MAGWLVLVVACLVVGASVGTRTLTDAETGSGESGRVDRVVESAAFPDPVVENVLIMRADGATLSPGQRAAAIQDLERAYSALPAVASVGQVVPSSDGTAAMLPVTMDAGGKAGGEAVSYASEQVASMQAATAAVQGANPGLMIEQVGDASLEASLGHQLDADFKRAELLSVPVTLLILIVAFGALIAAGVPVLLALTAVAGAIGLSAIVSQLMPVTDVLSSVVLLIGMAVGVDYSLFYVRRAREERSKGASTLDSVEIAAATSGRAVVISGAAVMIAMGGMFLSGNAVFTSLAVGTILVVAMAVLGSLTVLPAVLAKLGDRIDRPRVPVIHRLRRPAGEPGRFWPGLMRVVLARPAVSLTVGVVALLALAAPAVGMNLRESGPNDLPRTIAELRTYDRLVAAYPEEGTTHTVVVWSDRALDTTLVRAEADRLATAAAATGLFVDGAPAPEFSPDGTVARYDLAMQYGAEDPRAAEALDLLRGTLLPSVLGSQPGVEAGVTGAIANDADFSSQMSSRLPLVIGFVLALTVLVLLLAFRSPVIAATAVILNLLSVAAAYGLLVLVFQNTWAEGLLGFQSSGAIISWLPLFLFVVLFGLSMDYHVFVVSRIREAVGRGLSTKEAVADGITSSAGVVTSAAIVMVGVFAIFATLSLLDFKQMGIGLAAAVLIDATIVRALLLPSAMALLGHWNWWTPKAWQPQVATAAEPPPAVDSMVDSERAGEDANVSLGV